MQTSTAKKPFAEMSDHGIQNYLLDRETPDGFCFVLKSYVNDFGCMSKPRFREKSAPRS